MKSVPWVLQWMWAIRMTSCQNCQNLEDIGAPQKEPSREKGNQGDQPPKLPTPLKEPRSKEPKVPAGSKDPQVEVDKGKRLGGSNRRV